MPAPLAFLGTAVASGGIRAALGAGLKKVGGWLFGTKLRTALTAFTAGSLFTGNNSAPANSEAAAQLHHYRG